VTKPHLFNCVDVGTERYSGQLRARAVTARAVSHHER
jgi:hypothetical protein